jgi:hypothetical protein
LEVWNIAKYLFKIRHKWQNGLQDVAAVRDCGGIEWEIERIISERTKGCNIRVLTVVTVA